MAWLNKRIVIEGLSRDFFQFKNFSGTAFKNSKSTTRSLGLGITDPGSTISYGEFDGNGDLVPGGIYVTGGDMDGVTRLMEALEDDGWHVSWAKDRDGNQVPYIGTKIQWKPEDSWLNVDVYKINANGDAVEIPNSLVGQFLNDLQTSRIEYVDVIVRPSNYEDNKQSAWMQEIQVKLANTISPLASKRRVIKADEEALNEGYNEPVDEEEELPFN